MRRNYATGNSNDGFDDFAGENNRYLHNTAIGNDGSGFQSAAGTLNSRFLSDIAKKNGHSGFHMIAVDRVHLIENIAIVNFRFNAGSLENGITVSELATLRGNVMKRNEGTDAVDMNVDCGTNVWRKNIFRTTNNPGCID